MAFLKKSPLVIYAAGILALLILFSKKSGYMMKKPLAPY